MTTMQLVQGKVTRVNARGFQLDGNQTWWNISKFAGFVEMPEVGRSVTVTVDASGYVRGVEAIGVGERVNERDSSPVREPVNEVPQTCGPRPEKDIVVTRLAVLNTATAIASSGGQETDVRTVIGLAEELETWATRPC